MRRTLVPVLLLVFLPSNGTASSVTSPAHLWSLGFGGPQVDQATSVAVDPDGTVFVAGGFTGTVDFGGGPLVSAGDRDIFLVCFNANGTHRWSKRFGGTGEDIAHDVTVDAATDVWITGHIFDFVGFGSNNWGIAGQVSGFFARFSAPLGAHELSGAITSTSVVVAEGIAVDINQAYYVTGRFHGIMSIGGLTSVGDADIFIRKVAPNGIVAWNKRAGGAVLDSGYGITVDDEFNVYVTGSFQQTADFGGENLVSAGGPDAFVVKLNETGVFQWVDGYGDIANDIGYRVATDWYGDNITVAGTFVHAGERVFLAQFDAATGATNWKKLYAGTNAIGHDVAVDAQGNVAVTGLMTLVADFGGGPVATHGASDGFLVRYSSTGQHLWSGTLGGTSADQGYGVGIDNARDVVVSGTFNATVNIGGGDLVSAGQTDVFVGKYSHNPAEPLITSIVDVGNDQGRQVKIRFDRSGYDNSSTPVLYYSAYRRDDAPPQMGIGSVRLDDWTQVGKIDAHKEATYGIDVPTIGDSTITLGQYRSTFIIRAGTQDVGVYYDSPPDSGYSLDNLAPGAPLNFVFAAGQLAWDESRVADFDYFSVYGSNTDDFGSAALVDYSVAPGLDVTSAPYDYYFVTATDFSGNEGMPARVHAVSGAGEAPASRTLSLSNYPNPFNPTTTLRYTLPQPGRVTIAIYDARGSHVATLEREVSKIAGSYTVGWDGTDDAGVRVSSGVYVARIEHSAGIRSRKMILLK